MARPLLLSLLVACKKDDPEPGLPAQDHPLVVVTEVEGPEGPLQYLHVVADWPEDLELDYSQSVELGEFPLVRAAHGAIFVYRPEDSTLERFGVDDEGLLRSETTISFAGEGITGYAAELVFSTPEQAWMIDEGTAQILEWNPTEMSIVRSIELDPAVLQRDALPVQLQQGVASSDRVFTAVSWRDWYTGEYYAPAALGWFDLASPDVFSVAEHPECASSVALNPFLDEQGYVYLVGDAALGYDKLAHPSPTPLPQCVVRMAPGQDTFDEGFFVDLHEATGSPGFYTAHPMRDRHLLVNRWSPEVDVAEVADPVDPNWYWNYPPHFDYAIVDLEAGTSVPVPDLPVAAVQFSVTLRVDDENYVQLYRQDGGTTLYHVDIDGTVTPSLESGSGTDVQYLGRL